MKDAAATLALLFLVCACAPAAGDSVFNWDRVNYVEFACKNSGKADCMGRDDRNLMAMTRGK